MNIVLDPLFIFGFGWGTVGAALATWLSEATVFGIFVYKLRGKSAVLGGFSFIVPLKKKYTLRIFKLGLPVATLNTLFAFVNMFLSRTASEQGGHIGLMAFTTGGQIEAITWNTSQGFSTGLSTFIAQNYAAGQKSRVKQAWRTTMWMTGVFGSLCSLLFIFFGSEVFSIFVPEAEAYRVGGDFLRIDGYSQMFMMMEITMQGVFYGLGRDSAACHCQHRMQLHAYSGGVIAGAHGYGSGCHLVGSKWNDRCQRSYSDSLVRPHQKENSLKKGQNWRTLERRIWLLYT